MKPLKERILKKSPEEFAALIRVSGVNTGYVYRNEKNNFVGSNKFFNELATEIKGMSDYKNHEGIFIKLDITTQCLFLVFVHSTIRGQAQGGTRFISYNDLRAIVFDGLRLSKGMTDKNAISGLWWGGGKAIICPLNEEVYKAIDNKQKDIYGEIKTEEDKEGKVVAKFENSEFRKLVFTNYGKFIASLNGFYVAAEDAGTDTRDMENIVSVCRHITCLSKNLGGSGNPSGWTAKGVKNSMLATMKHYEGKNNLEDKIINIQGVGNVGYCLAKEVLEAGALKIRIYDSNKHQAKKVKHELEKDYPNKIDIVNKDEIFSLECDIFSPCAVGAILNKANIEVLNCKYVIGAANNQLEDPNSDYLLLKDRQIIYLPDFFINRLGIINCANEQYGYLETDIQIEVDKIYDNPKNGTLRLLEVSDDKGKSPQEIAMEWATEWADGADPKNHHPIWRNSDTKKPMGHRGAKLMTQYVNSNPT